MIKLGILQTIVFLIACSIFISLALTGYAQDSYLTDKIPVKDSLEHITCQAQLKPGVKFGQSFQLMQRKFCDSSFFTDATIPCISQFDGSVFMNNVDFDHTRFEKFVDFSNAEFRREVNFKGTCFKGIVFMSDITTGDTTKFDFYKASLPALMDFSFNKQIHNEIDFTNSNLNDPLFIATHSYHYINLYNSDISKLKLDFIHFKVCLYNNKDTDKTMQKCVKALTIKDFGKGRVNSAELLKDLVQTSEFKDYIAQVFPGIDQKDPMILEFTSFYLGNSGCRRLSRDETIEIYVKLMHNFELNGQKISYQLADIEYRNFVNGEYNISHIWYCYGYEKARIFFWAATFLFIFTLINYKFYDLLIGKEAADDTVYNLEKFPKLREIKKHKTYNQFKYALIYTCVIFLSLNLSSENFNYKKPGFFYILLINVTGVICLGYILNFILQK